MNEIETMFPFVPRSPIALQKKIKRLIINYGCSSKKASSLVKSILENKCSEFFLLWDVLGTSDKDLELEYICALVNQCWKWRAVPPDVKCIPDVDAERLLTQTLETGFNKECHFNFIKERERDRSNIQKPD